MSEHTKGELLVSSSTILVTKECKIIARTEPLGIGDLDVGIEEAMANAERLKLCWNNHDELLTALRDIVQYDEARRKMASQDPGIIPKSVVCKIAEVAIAKVQPSSQSVSS